jgi:hypothetical protein
MKKLINVFVFLFFVAAVTACGGGGTASKVIGKWKFDTVDGKGAPGKMGEITMEFKKDGEMEVVMGSKANKGKYEVSKDGKEITLKSLDGKGKDEVFKSVEFEKDKMSFNNGDGKKVVMKKQ